MSAKTPARCRRYDGGFRRASSTRGLSKFEVKRLNAEVVLLSAVGAGVEFVCFHLAAQGVAVDSQDFCGAGLVSVGTLERAADKFLFELVDCFIEQYSAFD